MARLAKAGLRIFRTLAALALVFASASCGLGEADDTHPAEPIGLYTSLPILWRETDALAGMLDRDAPRHWVLAALEQHGAIRPVDSLDAADGAMPLPRGGLLVLAQPRPLVPGENVALDGWVRAGGRVLLFADPMLTIDSSFALGDRRRPQDVVLLSPILSRWGLRLTFDEGQAGGERLAEVLSHPVPVNLPGRFELLASARDCVILGGGLLASCHIGAGRVLAFADAALLEEGPAHSVTIRRAFLHRLITFLETGEQRGMTGESR